jgi:hypothetical protein
MSSEAAKSVAAFITNATAYVTVLTWIKHRNDASVDVKYKYLIMILNGAWNDLVTQKHGTQFMRLFEDIKKNMPNESPQCLMFFFLHTSLLVLKSETFPGPNASPVDLYGVSKAHHYDLVISFIDEAVSTLMHRECHGVRWDDVSKLDSNKPFFEMRIKEEQ